MIIHPTNQTGPNGTSGRNGQNQNTNLENLLTQTFENEYQAEADDPVGSKIRIVDEGVRTTPAKSGTLEANVSDSERSDSEHVEIEDSTEIDLDIDAYLIEVPKKLPQKTARSKTEFVDLIASKPLTGQEFSDQYSGTFEVSYATGNGHKPSSEKTLVNNMDSSIDKYQSEFLYARSIEDGRSDNTHDSGKAIESGLQFKRKAFASESNIRADLGDKNQTLVEDVRTAEEKVESYFHDELRKVTDLREKISDQDSMIVEAGYIGHTSSFNSKNEGAETRFSTRSISNRENWKVEENRGGKRESGQSAYPVNSNLEKLPLQTVSRSSGMEDAENISHINKMSESVPSRRIVSKTAVIPRHEESKEPHQPFGSVRTARDGVISTDMSLETPILRNEPAEEGGFVGLTNASSIDRSTGESSAYQKNVVNAEVAGVEAILPGRAGYGRSVDRDASKSRFEIGNATRGIGANEKLERDPKLPNVVIHNVQFLEKSQDVTVKNDSTPLERTTRGEPEISSTGGKDFDYQKKMPAGDVGVLDRGDTAGLNIGTETSLSVPADPLPSLDSKFFDVQPKHREWPVNSVAIDSRPILQSQTETFNPLKAAARNTVFESSSVQKSAPLETVVVRQVMKIDERENTVTPRASDADTDGKATMGEIFYASAPRPAARPNFEQAPGMVGNPAVLSQNVPHDTPDDEPKGSDITFGGSQSGGTMQATHAGAPQHQSILRFDGNAVIRQVTEAFARLSDQTVELRLAPEELGRIRMYLHSGEHGIVVNIQADRTETLDLMRRHVDELARNLADAGYENAGFTFGDDQRQRDTSLGDPLDLVPAVDEELAPLPSIETDGADGLDIRM
ncbi:flagellar hook-length control protein FliK [Sagittula stellata]|uniref:flagellar hook-length control protein FliK n=1 Tax=Sagittula stellata TaxID=52603 RepID=UPI0012F4DE11|nr:flagellar hook-length control protein FliK [Sagittula stellata]